MNRFGAGKEHRLRWFLGLTVPARSTEKEILAKGLLLHPNDPAPGQCSKDKTSPRSESQPGMGQASLVMDISPRGIVPPAPARACPADPRPWLCPCPHAVSVACGAMLQDSQTTSPLFYLRKELTNQTPPPSSDAGGALRHGGASEWPPGTGEALKPFTPVSLGAGDTVALQRGLCWRGIFSPAR